MPSKNQLYSASTSWWKIKLNSNNNKKNTKKQIKTKNIYRKLRANSKRNTRASQQKSYQCAHNAQLQYVEIGGIFYKFTKYLLCCCRPVSRRCWVCSCVSHAHIRHIWHLHFYVLCTHHHRTPLRAPSTIWNCKCFMKIVRIENYVFQNFIYICFYQS